jgi:23S rRNA (cytidine1920-2'-O)/16S rRNA (cytidine1409-2'-O)-methyltransferase
VATIKKIKIVDLLVDRELASSVKEAKALVMSGKVIVNERRVDKAGEMFSPESLIRVKGNSKYVSRAGEKLESALNIWNLESEIVGSVCLDVGASTGGFTDCLLQFGAKQVYTVDVGTNQLDWKIRNHENVIPTEKTDFRDFDFSKVSSNSNLDWIVADVSFISLITLLPGFEASSQKGTKLLLMVKPQFELPKDVVPEGGIVSDQDLIDKAVGRVSKEFEDRDFKLLGVKNSQITGRFGNQEVFIYLERL